MAQELRSKRRNRWRDFRFPLEEEIVVAHPDGYRPDACRRSVGIRNRLWRGTIHLYPVLRCRLMPRQTQGRL